MREECLNYHIRLAELIAIKEGENYAKKKALDTSNNLLCTSQLRINLSQRN